MDANDHIVGALFHATLCFEVPVYQRPYVWSEPQWEHLWDDMRLLADEVLKTNSPKPEDEGKRAAILEHSGLAINRMLTRYKTWDEHGIKERGTTLFEAALKVWPRPSMPSDPAPV